MVILIITGIIVAIFLGILIASFQNAIISDCLDRKRMHDKILVGELDFRYISDSELVGLSRPLWTHIGVGGIGPCYNPSFTVFCLVVDELTRRRSRRIPEVLR